MQKPLHKGTGKSEPKPTPKQESPLKQEAPSSGPEIEHTTPEMMLYLQRTIGNQAVLRLLNNPQAAPRAPRQVQRVLITAEKLKSVAGEPKEDRLFIGMSMRYKAVLADLKAYRTALQETPIAAVQTARAVQFANLNQILDKLEVSCSAYVTEHTEAMQKAKAASGKASQATLEMRRFDEINILLHQIAGEGQILRKVLNSGLQIGDLWLTAMLDQEAGGPNSAAALRKNLIVGNPIEEQMGKPAKYKGAQFTEGFSDTPIPDPVSPAPVQGLTGLKSVTIQADTNNPVILPFGQAPGEAQLYTYTTYAQGEQVVQTHSFNSTIAAPSPPGKKIAPGRIFIGDTPTNDDIQQGQIGSCYLLAVLDNVVRTNPAFVRRMFLDANGVVKVSLYRHDDATDTWVRQEVQVPPTVSAKGSKYKLATQPISSEWFVLKGMSLPTAPATYNIKRNDLYEAALWVAMFEKAAARFAETYGQYGMKDQGNPRLKEGKQRPGMDIIEGGRENLTYGIFYGPALFTNGQQETSYSAADKPSELLQKNRAILETLWLTTHGIPTTGGASQQTHISVNSNRTEHGQRDVDAINFLLKSDTAMKYAKQQLGTDYAAFRGALEELVKKLKETLPKIDVDDDKTGERLKPVVNAAKAVVGKDAKWNGVMRDATNERASLFAAVLELSLNMTTIGTDNSTGQRNVYSRHAYAVHSADFKTKLDQSVAQFVPSNVSQIDADKSIVTLRNPHRDNTPNPNDTGQAGHAGIFTMTLTQFLRNFATLDVAVTKGT